MTHFQSMKEDEIIQWGKDLGWEIVKFMYDDDDLVKISQTKPSINKLDVKRNQK